MFVRVLLKNHFVRHTVLYRNGFLTVHFTDILRRNQPKFESPCSDRCVCDEEMFSPICGVDGITYFSACHAGCRNQTFGADYSAGYKVRNMNILYYNIDHINDVTDLCSSRSRSR